MSRAIKRDASWASLSPEARALIADGVRYHWRILNGSRVVAERSYALWEEVEQRRAEAALMGLVFECDDGLAWGLVSLADGEAAQRCAFGVEAPAPALPVPLTACRSIAYRQPDLFA